MLLVPVVAKAATVTDKTLKDSVSMTTAARDAALLGKILLTTIVVKDVTVTNGVYAIYAIPKGKIVIYVLTKDSKAGKLKKGRKLRILSKIYKVTLDAGTLYVYTFQDKL